MAFQDRHGNALTTASDQARDHYVRGVDLFLGGHYAAAEAFADATAADPTFALGHAGHARALMMQGQMPQAKAALAAAQAQAAACDSRERDHIAALARLLGGDAPGARAAVRAHVRDHPRDALVAQMCTNVFGLIGFSGAVGREAALLAYTEALLPHYGEDWWMMSMHALSLCETGQMAASERLMEAALALNPRNANGAHFKAHAQYEVGETAAGRAYLQDWMAGYDPRSVLHGHLSWHLALWALHSGDVDGLWDAVDAQVGPDGAQGLPINVLTDTVAIMYRAEMAGVPVSPARWARMSDYAAQYFPKTGQSFADIHAALAHAMAGQGDRLAQIADGADGFAGDLARPVARAFGLMARGAWAAAVAEMAPVLVATERLGGSRAQRDLLELAYVNALMKAGQVDEARRSLIARRPVLAAAPPVQGLH
ncbi:MAG: tetratricopeptide repeat protein [Pseudomonadota bacterium]